MHRMYHSIFERCGNANIISQVRPLSVDMSLVAAHVFAVGGSVHPLQLAQAGKLQQAEKCMNVLVDWREFFLVIDFLLRRS
jgi:hypothetical protein